MSDKFFKSPILNSPYKYPEFHWELTDDGQPTENSIPERRKSSYVTPVPKPKKRRRGQADKEEGDLFQQESITVDGQTYDQNSMINAVRQAVDSWRNIPDSKNWGVTPETARLLKHWRHHDFTGLTPFFCQVEAAETAIFLTEVAPKWPQYKKFQKYLKTANEEANPELFRLALKLATGAGKTTVMAMIIAWQTVNAVRHPSSKMFSKGFLIVAPGITIRDRLRVLNPNDPESYYESREILPREMLPDIQRAKILITNYHSFKKREKSLPKGNRSLLQGRGEKLQTEETEGKMVNRVLDDLMGMKNIVVINDEAHHCYREKSTPDAGGSIDELKGDDKTTAKKQNEYARLWISGIEAIKRVLGVRTVFDLSATPFFLAGSGYQEGTLFPWVMSDFSLMDAIECGIVKLPRVPILDNSLVGDDMPKLRALWQSMKDAKQTLPNSNRNAAKYDPLALPSLLITALEALYGHYKETYEFWEKEKRVGVPPVFIVVCQNTAISDLVYRYISGFEYEPDANGESPPPHLGQFPLFRNYDEHGQRLARPNTLLIDSAQLESGDALDKGFRKMAADEIERFRDELRNRTNGQDEGDKISDAKLLREAMNTVGKKGKLGEQIRCVVSVSMLTEGWDTNTVTHVLGVRAFGTQLLCEQVVGRGLRRQSYELNEDGLFDVEYADILGIPFDFTAKPVVSPPAPPVPTVRVHAVRPERDHLEITFPRVQGYRVELPKRRTKAEFHDDHTLTLTPELIGPTKTVSSGIVGEKAVLNVEHLAEERTSTIRFKLTTYLIKNHYRDKEGQPEYNRYGQLKPIVRDWLDNHLVCESDTQKAQVLIPSIADMACENIRSAIVDTFIDDKKTILAVLDPYNPTGSSDLVNFNTSKSTYATDSEKCHVNFVVTDSDWEAEFARVAESHPQVRCYVKNQSLGFEVPYRMGSDNRRYIPDFILVIDDGHDDDDPLYLVAEVKGYRGEDAKQKSNTMKSYWVPGINNLETFGRWHFAEFTQPYTMEDDLTDVITEMITSSIPS